MDELTPSEDLMVEALLARLRLGETLWTFEKRHRKIAKSLQDRGLVHWEPGVVNDTVRVWMTSEFIERYATYDYRSPRYASLQAAAEAVLDAVGRRCDACLYGTTLNLNPDDHAQDPPCAFASRKRLQQELEKLNG